MDRIVVITGGTSGIGKELVGLFQQSNDTVLTLARSVKDDDVNGYKCDVSDETQVKTCIDDIAKRFGRIDILINNAGFGMSGITELIPISKVKNIFDVNYMGLVNTTNAALPYMSKGSKVINVASAMAFFPVPYRAHYASVKSAVVTLTYAQRQELKPLGIDMCCICPGDVKTNFTANRVKDFDTNDRYGDAIKKATDRVDSREDKRMPVDKCAKQMYKIINKKRTKPMYIIGNAHKLLYFVARFVPKKLLLWSISKACT